jgi:hypothetical protein
MSDRILIAPMDPILGEIQHPYLSSMMDVVYYMPNLDFRENYRQTKEIYDRDMKTVAGGFVGPRK